MYVSGKLPTYPSPKSTLTLTSHLGQNFGLGAGGRWAVSKSVPTVGRFSNDSDKSARRSKSGLTNGRAINRTPESGWFNPFFGLWRCHLMLRCL